MLLWLLMRLSAFPHAYWQGVFLHSECRDCCSPLSSEQWCWAQGHTAQHCNSPSPLLSVPLYLNSQTYNVCNSHITRRGDVLLFLLAKPIHPQTIQPCRLGRCLVMGRDSNLEVTLVSEPQPAGRLTSGLLFKKETSIVFNLFYFWIFILIMLIY